MALELLAAWGIAQAAGFLFKPVLEELAKDVAKDKAKDYVKGCFGSVFKSLHKDTLQKALANALKELLQLLRSRRKFRRCSIATIHPIHNLDEKRNGGVKLVRSCRH